MVESSFCSYPFNAPPQGHQPSNKCGQRIAGNSLWTHTLEGTKDASADTVLKVFQNISSLCDVFKWDFGSQTKLSIYIDHSIDSSSSSETQYILSCRYFFLFLFIFYCYYFTLMLILS